MSAVPLGASYYGRPENLVNKFLLSITRDASVIPDARFLSKDESFLDLKSHSTGNTKIIYAINTEGRSKSGIIELFIGSHKIKSVKNIVLNDNMPFKQNGGILSIPVTIDKQTAQVILLE